MCGNLLGILFSEVHDGSFFSFLFFWCYVTRAVYELPETHTGKNPEKGQVSETEFKAHL